MILKLPKNISLQDLYMEEDQTIWFLIWILKQYSPCDQYISQMILESPFQVIQTYLEWPRQYIQKNGELHGLSRRWYQNGQLWYEYYWKNGEQHGPDRGWYQNGQLWYEENWKNGRRHGLERAWYQNGQLKYENNLKNGVRHGLHLGWYDNGKLRYEHNWENGTVVSSKKIE